MKKSKKRFIFRIKIQVAKLYKNSFFFWTQVWRNILQRKLKARRGPINYLHFREKTKFQKEDYYNVSGVLETVEKDLC